jgi:hypothetical protein
MKTRLLLMLALLVFNAAAGVASAADAITVLDKSWEVGYSAQNEQQQLTEYVLPGEKVEAWSALVSRQVLFDPDAGIELGRLVGLIRDAFDPGCKKLRWKVVEQSRTKAIYTWSHEGCAGSGREAERTVIVRASRGWCRWAYATKSGTIDARAARALDTDFARLSCD